MIQILVDWGADKKKINSTAENMLPECIAAESHAVPNTTYSFRALHKPVFFRKYFIFNVTLKVI